MHAGGSPHFCSVYWSKKKEIQILLLSLLNRTGAPAHNVGRCQRERKCVVRRTVRGATQECL